MKGFLLANHSVNRPGEIVTECNSGVWQFSDDGRKAVILFRSGIRNIIKIITIVFIIQFDSTINNS